MTAEVLEVTLGSLCAAGIDPDRFMDWPWAKIMRTAKMITAYHQELFARIWTGKSPVLERAKSEASKEALARLAVEQLRLEQPDAKMDVETAKVLAAEEHKLREVARLGFGIKPAEQGAQRVDGFSVWRKRREEFLAEERGAAQPETKPKSSG